MPGLNLPFEIFVWLAWSVKESVYKYLKRHEHGLVFSPTKIMLCNIYPPSEGHDYYCGEAVFAGVTYYLITQITEDCIHTVIFDSEDFGYDAFYDFKMVDADDKDQLSFLAYDFLQQKLKELFPGDIRIEKSPIGYPVIILNDALLDIAASLSHDGRFVAYSIEI